MATIRDYTLTELSATYVHIRATSNKSAYRSIPTLDEINDTLGTSYTNVAAGFIYSGGVYYYGTFQGMTSIRVAPSLPEGTTDASYAFNQCTALRYAPVIPQGVTSLSGIFSGCVNLVQPTSVPASVTDTSDMYDGCTNISGYMVIRSSSLTVTDMFKDTVEPIYFYAPNLDSQTIEDIEQSANNGNVTCLGSLPSSITPVTDRGEGSRTTYVDMNRMVNNAVIAVSTYCPARMVYTANDIVHQDEWLALVGAAQTIDNTITESTHYSNLNKIEKALESAL